MLSEGLITSIRAEPRSANTAIAKDVGIHLHQLHPHQVIKTFKKSSTNANCLAVTPRHIFAAQADKAVVHVYSREQGNQESLVPFPERISCLALVSNDLVAIGTVNGRVMLWETLSGRQVLSPAAHLQPVTCMASSAYHLMTGSEDSNIQIWSLPKMLAMASQDVHHPLRNLSNHRASITSLVADHGPSSMNICVSSSMDNSIIVWNYNSGHALRTFLLHSTPMCLALDPCDRGVFAGFQDGTLQLVEFYGADSIQHPLCDPKLQSTPVPISSAPWTTPTQFGAVLSLGICYDTTSVYSGHDSGKIAQWDTGRRAFSTEVADLNAPVTNLCMQEPFSPTQNIQAVTVIKPKLGENNYTVTAQLVGSLDHDDFEAVLYSSGDPLEMIEQAQVELSHASQTSELTSAETVRLREENAELWKLVHEQRALHKQTRNNQSRTGGA